MDDMDLVDPMDRQKLCLSIGSTKSMSSIVVRAF
jgi:hypothetical protein